MKGASLEMEGSFTRPPMERTPQNVKVFRMAREVAMSLGFEVVESSSGGTSDGNRTSALGVPTLDGMGAVGWGAHSRSEAILVPEAPTSVPASSSTTANLATASPR